MKTVTYILNSELDRGQDLPKVVDLEIWKAEHLMEPDKPDAGPTSAPERYGGREPVRRRRRKSAVIWDWTELAVTLAVIAAFAALAARVLLF